ncbi:ABC transporter permease [Paenibacillaceae bacterium]|nr:ABC transporter permease [Paenibacillaceae bacterium]
MRLHLKRILPTAIWVLSLLAIWELVSWILTIREVTLAQSKLPYVHELMLTLASYGPTILSESAATLANSGTGFLLGTITGILLAITMSLSFWAERVAFPYVILSQMIPVLGLAPIIYGIVHDDNWSRIIIAGYITFFPVSLNMLKGLKSASPGARQLMHAYAASRWSIYTKLLLPNALPGLFSGLKIAAPLSVTAAILVELMGAKHGIGVIMLRNLYYGPSNTYMFWSTVIAAAILGIANYLIIVLIERIVTPWQPAFRGKGGGR